MQQQGFATGPGTKNISRRKKKFEKEHGLVSRKEKESEEETREDKSELSNRTAKPCVATKDEDEPRKLQKHIVYVNEEK